MELIERGIFLNALETEFDKVSYGEGHCILLCGEAGMGKTSLANTFCRFHKNNSKIFQGSCDALFTPRPLAPLYDIAWQIRPDLWQSDADTADRSAFFNSVFRELSRLKEPAIVVFEDIHWADEATLDFIKFLARRIAQTRCLFILTYRDNEIHPRHPLRNVLGQLPAYSFSRLQLTPLSKQAVEKLAVEKGYNGEDVYAISGGNPFYVNEILASYSPGIPDNIKDAILSVYNLRDKKTKELWEVLSVLPTGFELNYLLQMDASFKEAIESSLESKILTFTQDTILFKHELYRRTIESSLSPFVRIALNKKILDIFLTNFEQNQQTERIIHHAKNANEYGLVEQYAPLAAKQAASVGAHIEAAKLYFSAIEYYQGSDKNKQIELYEAYAYECYLTNRIKEAIIYQGKVLNILKEKQDAEKTGNCMRFLSRLWWYDGNQKHADSFANQAINVLNSQPSSAAKAMAFSNMSQLKMLANQAEESLFWGNKAMAMAEELGNNEVKSHALNNIGAVNMAIPSSWKKGIALLQQSLQIALDNSYHEHAARAYTNMASYAVEAKDYALGRNMLDAGIQYCDERDLDSWTNYMLSFKSRLNLETGQWDEALRLADGLVRNENQASIAKIVALAVMSTIKFRRGDSDAEPLLLEAKAKAFEAMELQRIIPVLVAALEFEWITGKVIFEDAEINIAINMLDKMGDLYKNSEFAFWLKKAKKQVLPIAEFYGGYNVDNVDTALKAASIWEQVGCPYEQALALFEAGEEEKRKAVAIVQQLGANAVYEKMKLEMRASGIKSIPRGLRKSTQSNSANLTERELDVLYLLKEGLQNKEIADRLFISAKTVDHHISSLLFKLEVNTRAKAVQEATRLAIIK